ncbi:hypothetical protein [Mycoplasma seminis]|uniref:Uncharacterized protein n=1 Tax=Mycoplasma seminis TaxID=512749 RepID=A0ABY9HA45_9MOLU|nr:hypothetical protein [Mycoplasma seminis]WLP85296.1 hypothetical protein Q8852_03155 [Mycoplasma seminis]
MKEQKPIQKIKIAILATLSAIIAIILFVFAGYKVSHPFKPSFYNYKSYMSPSDIAKIQENFTYKGFDEINEFTNALVNNKAIGGIGSDFQAIDLIKKGQIKKIDFKKLFAVAEPNLAPLSKSQVEKIRDEEIEKINEDFKNNKISKQEMEKRIVEVNTNAKEYFDRNILFNLNKPGNLEMVLKSIYSPIVFEHLASYDEQLSYVDKNGKQVQEHLWEYFIPYFAQDGMVAYNTNKSQGNKNEITLEQLQANASELSKKYGVNINEFSILNQLNVLKKNGYSNFVITDAIRTNMLYGSGYDFNGDKLKFQPYSGISTEKNYKDQILQFGNVIKQGSSFPVNDSKHITLDGDGQNIIARVLDPSYPQADSGIVYNGDMLDMYYSENNYADVKDGSTLGYKIDKNVLLTDGVMVKADISDKYETKLYQAITSSFLQNIAFMISEMKMNNGKVEFKESLNTAYKHYSLKIYQHYLFYVLEKYFKDVREYNDLKEGLLNLYEKTLDDISLLSQYDAFVEQNIFQKENILNIFKQNAQEMFGDSDLNNLKDNIINLVNHVDLSAPAFENDLKEKYGNLVNFDFVNYTPPMYLDYNFIKRNYFISDNQVDQKAIYIYEIENNEALGIDHKAIKGVSEELLSLISTYYFTQFKG